MSDSTPMNIVTNPRTSPDEVLQHLLDHAGKGDMIVALMIMSWIETHCWELAEHELMGQPLQESIDNYAAWNRVRASAWAVVREKMDDEI